MHYQCKILLYKYLLEIHLISHINNWNNVAK